MDTAKSFRPDVIRERIGISYGYTFPRAGLFQCSLTGLVFNLAQEGEVKYKLLIWDDMTLESAGKLPGGPLFSIECAPDLISQVHLPHCEPDHALVAKSLSVVHITDDGMSFIKPQEINETHVVIDTPDPLTFGIAWDIMQRFTNFRTKPVKSQIVLYLRPLYRKDKHIVSVVLAQSNTPLQEIKTHYEDLEYIDAPSLCLLQMGQDYSLHSEPEGYKIQPAKSEFSESYGPNYHASFEIVLQNRTDEVTLVVKDQKGTRAWEHRLYLSDENRPKIRSDAPVEEKLQLARLPFIAKVSYPVLDHLLDVLLARGFLNAAEVKATKVKPRADKAQDLLDMVLKKGPEACSAMLAIFATDDPYRCNDLGLM
ncbi:uncharacterized protein ABDE67_021688 [Symphorus nematophorus]